MTADAGCQAAVEHFQLFGHAYGLTPEAERRSRRSLYAALGFERYAATRAGQLSAGTGGV